MMNYFLVSISSFLSYSLYVQFSPSIGNIWLRPDSENKMQFQISGLLSLIYRPFYDKYFWHLKNWDLNWIIYLLGFNGTYFIIKNF